MSQPSPSRGGSRATRAGPARRPSAARRREPGVDGGLARGQEARREEALAQAEPDALHRVELRAGGRTTSVTSAGAAQVPAGAVEERERSGSCPGDSFPDEHQVGVRRARGRDAAEEDPALASALTGSSAQGDNGRANSGRRGTRETAVWHAGLLGSSMTSGWLARRFGRPNRRGRAGHSVRAPYTRFLNRKRVCCRVLGAAAMKTATISSCGSMVKLVPPAPAHMASPTEPGE